MAILSGPRIEVLIRQTKVALAEGNSPPVPSVNIDPFRAHHVGPNSVDLTLAPKLLLYDMSTCTKGAYGVLDARENNPTYPLTIPAEGFVLHPGRLYLGSTVERTECHGLVPVINGRSSVGRLGISVHVTAGFGDDAFAGNWTLEIHVVEKVRIYAGMRICQIAFFDLVGERRPYRGRYQNQAGPVPSRLFQTEETARE